MKWKNEREEVLSRLTRLEARLTALEAAPVDTNGPDTPDPPPPPPDRDAKLEAAWSSVMNGDPGIQIAIVNPNDPRFEGGPFVVEDNKEHIKGEGASVVAAFDAYRGKGGKRHGDAATLDDFEYQQAEFFSAPGNVAAPTSCRRANQGYFCDFFRKDVTPAGGEKKGPFEAPGKAVEALRNELGSNL